MILGIFKKRPQHILLQPYFLNVIPPGFEPRSSEPESDILSIELWDHFYLRGAKIVKFPF